MSVLPFTRKRLLANLSLAMVAFAASEAHASSRWFDCTSGNMQTASCWSSNIKPVAGDAALVGYASYGGNVTASLTSGSFVADYQYIGYSGYTGTVNHSAGSNTANYYLVLGVAAGITGTYNLSGTGTLTANWETIGDDGIGSFVQSGGSHTVWNSFYIGANTGSSGSYNLQGGSLTTGTYGGYEYIGNAGTGTFTQSGGTHTANSQIALGISGNGTYNLRGGTLAAYGGIDGGNSPGTATLRIDGGALNLGAGGGINVDNLYVGTTGYTGAFTLTSNHQITAASEIIGQGGTGTFTQTGGTHTVGTLSIGTGLSGNGTFNMQGGTLTAGTIDSVNAGVSAFNFTGGTLAVGTFIGNLVNNGGTLAPGASPGTTLVNGNYTQIAAGILSIELGGIGAGQFDVLDVTGTATLGGELEVLFWNGFVASAGDSFDIVTTTTLLGGFDSFDLAALGGGLVWNVDYLYDIDVSGTDVVRLSVQAVPEPEAYAMMLAGLGLVSWAARRRQVH